jgi:hypothetical protein
MKLKWILIIAAEFLALFYVFHLLDLIDLKTFVTLGVVEIMAGVLGYYLGRWGKSKDEELENKNKKREKLNGYLHENNRILIETVIKDWYGEQKPLSLVGQQKAIEHLQTGYPNVWKLWFEECGTLKSQISEDEKIIKEYIKNKSKEGILLYSELENIFNVTYLYGDESKTEAELIYELLDVFAANGQVPEKIENSKRIIETIVNDKPLHELFGRVNKNKKLLNKKINEFEQCLEKIVYDFEIRHIELKGTCIDCKDWHEELKSPK